MVIRRGLENGKPRTGSSPTESLKCFENHTFVNIVANTSYKDGLFRLGSFLHCGRSVARVDSANSGRRLGRRAVSEES